MSWTFGKERGLQPHGPGSDSRPALPSRSTLTTRISSLSARRPRLLDSQSGDAGSNPAKDAGLPHRPSTTRARLADRPTFDNAGPTPLVGPLSPSWRPRPVATNDAVEVRLLAGRPLSFTFAIHASDLTASDASLRSSPIGFDSRQRLRREGRSQTRLITSSLPVQFRPLPPRCLVARGTALIRLIQRVRFPPSRPR